MDNDAWIDPFALSAEEELEMIRAAVADPKDREIVVQTLRELGWTITPPDGENCG